MSDPEGRETIAVDRHEMTGRAGCFWQPYCWSEELSAQTPLAQPMENSFPSGWSSWA